jgi:hypothetical protein
MSSVTYPNGQTLTSDALTVEQVNTTTQTITAQLLGYNPVGPADPAYYFVRIVWAPEGQPAWKRTENIAFIRCVEAPEEYGKLFDLDNSVNSLGTITTSANLTKGNATVTGLSNTATMFNGGPLQPGFTLFGIGLAPRTAIVSVPSATTITISPAPTLTLPLSAIQISNNTVTQTLTYQRTWSINWTLYGANAYDRTRQIRDGLILDWCHDAFAAEGLYLVPQMPRPVRVRELFEGEWWQRVDLTNVLFNELVTDTIITPSIASTEMKVFTDQQGLVADVTVPNVAFPG